MKISVSPPTVEVEFLDSFAHAHAYASRSAALQHAVRLLRESELEDAYAVAWDEWESGGDARLWEEPIADGLGAQ